MHEIDRDRSATRRREMREARAAKAVPAREWVARERESRILPKRYVEPVTDMYRSSMAVSPQWARHFRTFWNLDENFCF